MSEVAFSISCYVSSLSEMRCADARVAPVPTPGLLSAHARGGVPIDNHHPWFPEKDVRVKSWAEI